VVYQLTRIEAHLAALPKRGDDGRLSPPEQIATAVATKVRTADAVLADEALFLDVEASMMKLADVIASTYFTLHERSDDHWETLG
jgi:hypothetical protein